MDMYEDGKLPEFETTAIFTKASRHAELKLQADFGRNPWQREVFRM